MNQPRVVVAHSLSEFREICRANNWNLVKIRYVNITLLNLLNGYYADQVYPRFYAKDLPTRTVIKQ